MRKLGIGMVGYGAIGRVHAMGYRNLPFNYGLPSDTIRIVGVATTKRETAKRAAVEVGCDVWVDDYRELVTRDDIDIIDICVPNSAHEEIITAAARAGKHVYCEKPLATSVAEGQRIVKAVELARVNNQVTFNFRFYPAITRAKQLMEEGFVGRVLSFHGKYLRSSYVDRDKPLSWRTRKEVSGGGALFDLGVHILDLLSFLLGDIASTLATLDTLIVDRPVATGSVERAPVDVDDLALLQLRLPSGAVGTVEASRVATGVPNGLGFEIYGELGAIRFRSEEPGWLEVYDGRDTARPLGGMRGFRRIESMQRYPGAVSPDWSMVPDFVRGHAECQYQFLEAVSDGRPARPSFADALHVQRILAAAERSSADGRWVATSQPDAD